MITRALRRQKNGLHRGPYRAPQHPDSNDGQLVYAPTEGPLKDELAFQTDLIGDLAEAVADGEDPSQVVCQDPATGKPLTRRQFMNRYSQMLMIAEELLARTPKEPNA